ncbi:nuclear transport factor 2 family protein [Vibrio sp. SS-MA-C1-2]|uniref:nuclear transport factor 2 family protein n=1 Tax=Vibrio sp. SS-MA-C1-2 TaxID=2908646 RepID=UPI001F1B446C|nr:nuclear transport factor 2 family protein [Vibrio sp. SS-MA-C1-2]UJF18368.1 nuclear transport factor 2 family protein [Vibrio sp. SS-MA-C1-2]
MSKLIDDFCKYYQDLSKDKISSLSTLYQQDAVLEDPVHKLTGLNNIEEYFSRLLENISYCQFDIETIVIQDQTAFITWVMRFAHPKINQGNEIAVPGVSHLLFIDKINYHRDYYDLGGMLYEHIPLLNMIIKKIKSGLS